LPRRSKARSDVSRSRECWNPSSQPQGATYRLTSNPCAPLQRPPQYFRHCIEEELGALRWLACCTVLRSGATAGRVRRRAHKAPKGPIRVALPENTAMTRRSTGRAGWWPADSSSAT